MRQYLIVGVSKGVPKENQIDHILLPGAKLMKVTDTNVKAWREAENLIIEHGWPEVRVYSLQETKLKDLATRELKKILVTR